MLEAAISPLCLLEVYVPIGPSRRLKKDEAEKVPRGAQDPCLNLTLILKRIQARTSQKARGGAGRPAIWQP